jgi:hypothetical protein
LHHFRVRRVVLTDNHAVLGFEPKRKKVTIHLELRFQEMLTGEEEHVTELYLLVEFKDSLK